MSSTNLYRFSGLALLLGGLIFAVGNLIHPLEHSAEAYLSPTWVHAHVLMIVGTMALLVGLPGLYLRQMKRRGLLVLIGTLLTAVGLMGIMPGSWFEAFVAPVVSPLEAAQIENSGGGLFNAIAGLAFIGGPILLGVALLWAKVFSRWAALLLLLASLLLIVGPALPVVEGLWIIPATVIFSASFTWLGCQLFINSTSETKLSTVELTQPLNQTTAQSFRP